ncbi:uncharacterized protein [Rutidosis leptorrhynchoides]|uniref:uncharacterized protein n=1 Tax=Rutidosis leptorrhynchoides TaxID=125765 RepID=UPI003A99E32B
MAYFMRYKISCSIKVAQDEVLWVDINNEVRKFSVQNVWDSIRPRAIAVSWFRVVWFSQCMPRHAFLVWLLMGERLKTQDKLSRWELYNGVKLSCPLFNGGPDSRSHLFFECSYASQVWSRASGLTIMPMTNSWRIVCSWLSHSATRNSVNIVVAKLMFGAVVYFIWQERNNRIFKKSHETEVKLFDDIFGTVRLKLLSLKFKESSYVERMKRTWHL